MITKFFIKNVSETHNLNNPDEKTSRGCFDSDRRERRTKKNTNGDKIPEPQNKIATNTLKYIVIVKNNKNI